MRTGALFFTLMLVGCVPKPQIGTAVESVFRGFQYVGAYADDHHPIQPSSYDAQPLPRELMVGLRYAFHFTGPLNTTRFAIGDLPYRLKSAGFTDIRAPKRADDLPTVDPGDRSWVVTFRYGGKSGQISNTLDMALFERGGLTRDGSFEIIVLQLTQ